MDNIRIIFPKAEDTKFYCKVAIAHNLYVHGWVMFTHYDRTLNTRSDALFYGRPRSLIALAYDGDEPIACVLLHAYHLDTFVKTSYRRKGIGSRLFNEFVKHHELEGKFLVSKGIDGSERFFDYNDIPMTSDDDYLKGVGMVIDAVRADIDKKQSLPKPNSKKDGWTATFRSFSESTS